MAEVHLLSFMPHGMVAGAVGTIAMTVSELLEMSLAGREGSQVPGQVGAHLLPSRDPQSTSDVATLYNPGSLGARQHGRCPGSPRHRRPPRSRRQRSPFRAPLGGDAALYRALGIADVPGAGPQRISAPT